MNRPRRIGGVRACDVRHCRQRGGTRGQVKKFSAGKAHGVLPETSFSRETHPLIALTLTEYNSGDLIELLRNERLDAAFIRMYPAAPDGLVLSLLVNEAVIVALPEQHRLAKAGSGADAPLALRSLADETIIVQGGLLSWYTDVVAACRAARINPRIEEGPRLASTLNLVAVGLGVSLVPASLQRMRIDGVVYRRLRGTRLVSPLILTSRRGDSSAVVRQFLNFVRRAAKDHSSHRRAVIIVTSRRL
jgi:DNA-binding transcriptional LysR family regulator